MTRAIITAMLLASASCAASANAKPATPSTQQAEASAPQQEEQRAAMSEKEQRAGEIIRQMLPPHSVVTMESVAPSTQFGGDLARLAYENAYQSLWTRPGLSLKERSILTIGILIALGSEKELTSHFAGGLRNGLTPQQIEEMIYHATAYAGFPAASSAMDVARKVVDQQPRK